MKAYHRFHSLFSVSHSPSSALWKNVRVDRNVVPDQLLDSSPSVSKHGSHHFIELRVRRNFSRPCIFRFNKYSRTATSAVCIVAPPSICPQSQICTKFRCGFFRAQDNPSRSSGCLFYNLPGILRQTTPHVFECQKLRDTYAV